MQAALAAISNWKPGHELTVEQEEHESLDEDEELAAAMLAVATGDYHAHSAVGGISGEGRPLDVVLAEYLNGADETGVVSNNLSSRFFAPPALMFFCFISI